MHPWVYFAYLIFGSPVSSSYQSFLGMPLLRPRRISPSLLICSVVLRFIAILATNRFKYLYTSKAFIEVN